MVPPGDADRGGGRSMARTGDAVADPRASALRREYREADARSAAGVRQPRGGEVGGVASGDGREAKRWSQAGGAVARPQRSAHEFIAAEKYMQKNELFGA